MQDVQFTTRTKEEWELLNPVLMAGEIGFIEDEKYIYKIGDGERAWNEIADCRTVLEDIAFRYNVEIDGLLKSNRIESNKIESNKIESNKIESTPKNNKKTIIEGGNVKIEECIDTPKITNVSKINDKGYISKTVLTNATLNTTKQKIEKVCRGFTDSVYKVVNTDDFSGKTLNTGYNKDNYVVIALSSNFISKVSGSSWVLEKDGSSGQGAYVAIKLDRVDMVKESEKQTLTQKTSTLKYFGE